MGARNLCEELRAFVVLEIRGGASLGKDLCYRIRDHLIAEVQWEHHTAAGDSLLMPREMLTALESESATFRISFLLRQSSSDGQSILRDMDRLREHS